MGEFGAALFGEDGGESWVRGAAWVEAMQGWHSLRGNEKEMKRTGKESGTEERREQKEGEMEIRRELKDGAVGGRFPDLKPPSHSVERRLWCDADVGRGEGRKKKEKKAKQLCC